MIFFFWHAIVLTYNNSFTFILVPFFIRNNSNRTIDFLSINSSLKGQRRKPKRKKKKDSLKAKVNVNK